MNNPYKRRDKGEIPVIYRMSKGECTAVFPTLPGTATDPYSMTCYAHIGQHGVCTREWYGTTRGADLHHYQALHKELRHIYGRKLRRYVKLTQRMHRMRQGALK